MMLANTMCWPFGAASIKRQALQLMDVILHLGAHRTATTSFQNYVRAQNDDLARCGEVFWGPRKMRQSALPGLFRRTAARKGRNVTKRAEGRIKLLCAQEKVRGTQKILVSDAHILGPWGDNLRHAAMYPGAGERVARVAQAFGSSLRRIVLCIRSQDLWWASICALSVARGHPLPGDLKRADISNCSRSWRDVITDVSCAAPAAEIVVLPFEIYADQPDVVLSAALERSTLPESNRRWLNNSWDLPALRTFLREQGRDASALPDGSGRWQPFNTSQVARLREHYADDLHWLVAGADGLATLANEIPSIRAGSSAPMKEMIKGQTDDPLQGPMAQNS